MNTITLVFLLVPIAGILYEINRTKQKNGNGKN